MNNIFTKRNIVSLSIAIAAIILGLIFKDKTLFISIHDNYYVASYLTLGIFIIYLIVLINLAILVRASFKRYKEGR